jgi:hypothetical protein
VVAVARCAAAVEPGAGVAIRVLGLLALLLPACDRLEELLSVAAALPGLAVILRWARRRQQT